MISQEILVDIHVLHRQGNSIREISRQLRLSRNTVRRYLRTACSYPSYSKREQKTPILEPYKQYLLDRVEAAKPRWIPATVLCSEIKLLGYEGSVTTVKCFIRPFKKTIEDPVVRFETDPGVQMQVDFTTIKLGKNTIKAFVATLGFSRACYVKFTATEKQGDWLGGIQEALEYFEGVPKEILFDNAKCIMIRRDAYGEGSHQWNTALLEHAKKYGYKPKACKPYRAKTKGKVERFNSYLKQSFVTPLVATLKQAGLELTIDLANAKVGPWLSEVAHQREHGTTKEKPQVRLEQERQVFLALPKCVVNPLNIAPKATSPMPFESYQHPLKVYDQLLGVQV